MKKTDHESNMGEYEENEEAFVSQVIDILEGGEIAALVPISQGKLVRLPQTGRYNLVFHTGKGMIYFMGKITSYYKDGLDFMMKIKLLTEGEPMQRREFFRFTCKLPLRFIEIEEFEETDMEGMKSGTTEDISGGGLRFVSDDDVQEDARLRCLLDLGGDLLIFIGKIIRKDVIKEGSERHYDYRLVFVGILPSDQERIVRYIFNEQRRQLKAIR